RRPRESARVSDLRRQRVGLDAARLRRVHVLAVRKRRAEQRREIVVAEHALARELRIELDIGLVVVADRELVVVAAQETTPKLRAAAFPSVRRIAEIAAAVVRRERMRRDRLAVER